ncbi:MAG: zf-HC2 domain-containing protein [Acidobacteriota bacterium]
MKCEDVQMLIEDYVDRTLDQKAAALVKSHMGSCAACARFYQQLSREQEIYARYERDVEVTPALWASIETRIKQERAARPLGLFSRLREQIAGVFAGPRLSPALAAALVIIAIGITVAVMTYLNPRGGETTVAGGNRNTSIPTDEPKSAPIPEPPAPESPKAPGTYATNDGSRSDQPATPHKATKARIAQKHLATTAVLTPSQLVRDAEQKYLTAISMLSRDVNRQRSQLDPNLLARFDASLSDIDRTIKETRRVVRENPGDPIALQYLLAAYSKKVEMLRGMTTD